MKNCFLQLIIITLLLNITIRRNNFQLSVEYSRHLEGLRVLRKHGATNSDKSLRSLTADRYEIKTQDIALNDNELTDRKNSHYCKQKQYTNCGYTDKTKQR